MSDPYQQRFNSWAEVLQHVDSGGKLAYHAPMDLFPHRVSVLNRYKNGKLRIDAHAPDADPFTADADHLDRMRYA